MSALLLNKMKNYFLQKHLKIVSYLASENVQSTFKPVNPKFYVFNMLVMMQMFQINHIFSHTILSH